jgi:uncharacterized protein (DUF4415 family)
MPTKRAGIKRKWIDPDDAPELTDAELARAVHYDGERVIRRGRPKLANPKDQVTLRLDHDIVERFRASGAGWQSRINDALRRHLGRAPRSGRNA